MFRSGLTLWSILFFCGCLVNKKSLLSLEWMGTFILLPWEESEVVVMQPTDCTVELASLSFSFSSLSATTERCGKPFKTQPQKKREGGTFRREGAGPSRTARSFLLNCPKVWKSSPLTLTCVTKVVDCCKIEWGKNGPNSQSRDGWRASDDVLSVLREGDQVLNGFESFFCCRTSGRRC